MAVENITTTQKISISNIDSLELKFGLYYFFGRFWALAGIWMIFLMENGMTYSQIAIISMVYAGSMFVFEIPTGMISDYFGRKASLILAYVFKAGGILWIAFSTSFISFVLSILIWGIGMTMNSGSEQAWLYDELEIKHGKQTGDRYQKVYGLFSGIGLLSTALAIFIGGYLAQLSLSLPIILTGLIFIGVIALIFTFPEESKPKEVESTSIQLSKVFKVLVKPKLLILSGLGVINAAIITSLIYWMQLFMSTNEISLTLVGLVLSLGVLAGSVGSGWSKKLNETVGNNYFILMMAVLIVSFALMVLSSIWVILFLFLIIRFIRGAFLPYISTVLNQEFEKSYRATALSLLSALSTIGIMFSEFITSRIIENYSFKIFFLYASIVFGIIALPLAIVFKKLDNKI